MQAEFYHHNFLEFQSRSLQFFFFFFELRIFLKAFLQKNIEHLVQLLIISTLSFCMYMQICFGFEYDIYKSNQLCAIVVRRGISKKRKHLTSHKLSLRQYQSPGCIKRDYYSILQQHKKNKSTGQVLLFKLNINGSKLLDNTMTSNFHKKAIALALTSFKIYM